MPCHDQTCNFPSGKIWFVVESFHKAALPALRLCMKSTKLEPAALDSVRAAKHLGQKKILQNDLPEADNDKALRKVHSIILKLVKSSNSCMVFV